jgi:hypothetical protein
MAKKDQKPLIWKVVHIEKLPADLKNVLDTFLKAREAANKRRKEWEEAVTKRAVLARGQKLVFSYKWGTISLAVAEDLDDITFPDDELDFIK